MRAFGQALLDAGLATPEQRDKYLASLERAFIDSKRERLEAEAAAKRPPWWRRRL